MLFFWVSLSDGDHLTHFFEVSISPDSFFYNLITLCFLRIPCYFINRFLSSRDIVFLRWFIHIAGACAKKTFHWPLWKKIHFMLMYVSLAKYISSCARLIVRVQGFNALCVGRWLIWTSLSVDVYRMSRDKRIAGCKYKYKSIAIKYWFFCLFLFSGYVK